MVEIKFFDTDTNDNLFNYQELGNRILASGEYSNDINNYTIYTNNTNYGIDISSTNVNNYEIKKNDNVIVNTENIRENEKRWIFNNTSDREFEISIENADHIVTINVIMVPKIEIKETYSDTTNIIDFDRVGFKTDKEYQLIQNSSWYVRVYNDYDIGLDYSFQYLTNNDGTWINELDSDIYNDTLLINSTENKIIFKFVDNNSPDISMSIQFNKGLKNIILKNDDIDIGFSFESATMTYDIALPDINKINIIPLFFSDSEKWDISSGTNIYNLSNNTGQSIDIIYDTVIYIYHRGDEKFKDYYTFTIRKLYVDDTITILRDNGNNINELTDRFDSNTFLYFLSILDSTQENKKYDISLNYYNQDISTCINNSFQNFKNEYYFTYNSGIKQINIVPGKDYTILFNNSPTIFYIFNQFHEYKFEMNYGLKLLNLLEIDSITQEQRQLIEFSKNIYTYYPNIQESSLNISIDYNIYDISYNIKYYVSNTKGVFLDDFIYEKTLSNESFDHSINQRFSYHKLTFDTNTPSDMSYNIIMEYLKPISNITIKIDNTLEFNTFFRYNENSYVIPYRSVSDTFDIEIGISFNLSKIYNIHKYSLNAEGTYTRSDILDTFIINDDQNNSDGEGNKIITDVRFDDLIEIINSEDFNSVYIIKVIKDPIENINISYNNKNINYTFQPDIYTYDFIPILNSITSIDVSLNFTNTHISEESTHGLDASNGITNLDASNNGIIYFDLSSNDSANSMSIDNGRDFYGDGSNINKVVNIQLNDNIDLFFINKIIKEYVVFDASINENIKELYKKNTNVEYNFKFYKDLINTIDVEFDSKNFEYTFELNNHSYYFPILNDYDIRFKVDSEYDHSNNRYIYSTNTGYDNLNIINNSTYYDILNGVTDTNRINIEIVNTTNIDISYTFMFDKSSINELALYIDNEYSDVLLFDNLIYDYYISLNIYDRDISLNSDIMEDISFNYSVTNYSVDPTISDISNGYGFIDKNNHLILTSKMEDTHHTSYLSITNRVNMDVSYNIYIDSLVYDKVGNDIKFKEYNNMLKVLDFSSILRDHTNDDIEQFCLIEKKNDEVSGKLYIKYSTSDFSKNDIYYLKLGNLDKEYFIVQCINDTYALEQSIIDWEKGDEVVLFKIIGPYECLDFYDDSPIKRLINNNKIKKQSSYPPRYILYKKESTLISFNGENINYRFENMIYFSLFYRKNRRYDYNGYLDRYKNQHFISNNTMEQPPKPPNKSVIEANKDYWFCFYEPLIDHSGVEITFEIPSKHFFSTNGILNTVVYNNYIDKYDFKNEIEIYDCCSNEPLNSIKWEPGDTSRRYIYFKKKNSSNFNPNIFKTYIKTRIKEYLPKCFGKYDIYNPNDFNIADVSGYYDFTINTLGIRLESSTSGFETLHLSKNYTGTDLYYYNINYSNIENRFNSLFPSELPRLYFGFIKPFDEDNIDNDVKEQRYNNGVRFIKTYTVLEERVDLYLIKDVAYNYLSGNSKGYDSMALKMFSPLSVTSDNNNDGVLDYRDIKENNLRTHENLRLYFSYNDVWEKFNEVPNVEFLNLFVSLHDISNNKFVYDYSDNVFKYNNVKKENNITGVDEVYLSWLFYNIDINQCKIKFADMGINTRIIMTNTYNILENDDSFIFYNSFDINNIISDSIIIDPRGTFNNDDEVLVIDNYIVDPSNTDNIYNNENIYTKSIYLDNIRQLNNTTNLYNYEVNNIRNLELMDDEESRKKFKSIVDPSNILIHMLELKFKINDELSTNELFKNINLDKYVIKMLCVNLKPIDSFNIYIGSDNHSIHLNWTGDFPLTDNIYYDDITNLEIYFQVIRINNKTKEEDIYFIYNNDENLIKWYSGSNKNEFEYKDTNISSYILYEYTIFPLFKITYRGNDVIIKQESNIINNEGSSINNASKYVCYDNKHENGRYQNSGLTKKQILSDLTKKRFINK